MIIDKLENLNFYRGIHENLDRAIDFIRSTDLSALPLGRNTISGDDVFVNVVRTATVPEEGREFEYHRHYIDLHLDLSGSERIAVTLDRPHEIGPYDEENDGGLTAAGPERVTALLSDHVFAMALPGEPHLPLLPAEAPAPIHKCIFKIRVR